jgi:hypothetical protein
MPRPARVVAVGVPHLINHHGNNRQDVFLSDEDRRRRRCSALVPAERSTPEHFEWSGSVA